MRKKILFIAGMMACCTWASAQEISRTWVADKGNGTYQNPVLYADYSDPDVCAAGDDFYMTASSFNCIPGLPILHSRDLVNWSLVNYALPVQEPKEFFDKAQHGKGVWAPAIRFHKGELYIYWGDPDYGIYMIKTRDPKGSWSKPVLVKAGKGMIDPTPLWDEDGKVYLIHAYAGSRSGVNSILVICELNAEGTEVISDPVMVFDGNDGKNHTVEGPKLYKRNGYYYIFAPATDGSEESLFYHGIHLTVTTTTTSNSATQLSHFLPNLSLDKLPRSVRHARCQNLSDCPKTTVLPSFFSRFSYSATPHFQHGMYVGTYQLDLLKQYHIQKINILSL